MDCLNEKLNKNKMDHFKMLIILDPLSAPNWLFEQGWSFLINRASVDNKLI